MPKYDVITIGSAVRDIFLFLDKDEAQIMDNPKSDPACQKLLALEYGAKINIKHSVSAVGGGALNSAVTFSRLGFTTAAAVALGCDDLAAPIVRAMRREKISTGFVSYHSRHDTGFSVLLVDEADGEHVVLVQRGANEDNLPKFSKPGLTSAHWYFTTALAGPHWRETLAQLVETAGRKKINWAWNPGGSQLERGIGALGKYLKFCTVLILNHDEAVGLLRSETDQEKNYNIKHLLASLLSWGPRMVIITDGRDGAYYADSEQMLYIPAAADLEVVDSTGAGDAFGSAFVAGLIMTKMKNIDYALQLGMANAESVIGQVGAQAGIIQRRDLEKIMRGKRHKIKKIK